MPSPRPAVSTCKPLKTKVMVCPRQDKAFLSLQKLRNPINPYRFSYQTKFLSLSIQELWNIYVQPRDTAICHWPALPHASMTVPRGVLECSGQTLLEDDVSFCFLHMRSVPSVPVCRIHTVGWIGINPCRLTYKRTSLGFDPNHRTCALRLWKFSSHLPSMISVDRSRRMPHTFAVEIHHGVSSS